MRSDLDDAIRNINSNKFTIDELTTSNNKLKEKNDNLIKDNDSIDAHKKELEVKLSNQINEINNLRTHQIENKNMQFQLEFKDHE